MTAKPSYEKLMNKVHELQKAPHYIIGYSVTGVLGRQNRTVEESSDKKNWGFYYGKNIQT